MRLRTQYTRLRAQGAGLTYVSGYCNWVHQRVGCLNRQRVTTTLGRCYLVPGMLARLPGEHHKKHRNTSCIKEWDPRGSVWKGGKVKIACLVGALVKPVLPKCLDMPRAPPAPPLLRRRTAQPALQRSWAAVVSRDEHGVLSAGVPSRLVRPGAWVLISFFLLSA